MSDQSQEHESQDNFGTGAEISNENDAPANFYAVPVNDESQDHAGTGATISTDNEVPANSYEAQIALDSPSAAHNRRSSAIFNPRDDYSLNAAVTGLNGKCHRTAEIQNFQPPHEPTFQWSLPSFED